MKCQAKGRVKLTCSTASQHADSYVARQWAHRNVLTGQSVGGYTNFSHKNERQQTPTPRIFGPPVTVSGLRQHSADLFVENDGERKENKRRWADIVLPIHLLIAANTLRRPLIIFEVASDGQEGSENWGALGGVFLPVSCSPATCIREPILLLHKRDGFEVENGGIASHVNFSPVWSLSGKRLKQWFAPILPKFPCEGDKVSLVLHKEMPLHFVLEDEGQEEVLHMYMSVSDKIIGGNARVAQYPVLNPVFTLASTASDHRLPLSGRPWMPINSQQQLQGRNFVRSKRTSVDLAETQPSFGPSTFRSTNLKAVAAMHNYDSPHYQFSWETWFPFQDLWGLWKVGGEDFSSSEVNCKQNSSSEVNFEQTFDVTKGQSIRYDLLSEIDKQRWFAQGSHSREFADFEDIPDFKSFKENGSDMKWAEERQKWNGSLSVQNGKGARSGDDRRAQKHFGALLQMHNFQLPGLTMPLFSGSIFNNASNHEHDWAGGRKHWTDGISFKSAFPQTQPDLNDKGSGVKTMQNRSSSGNLGFSVKVDTRYESERYGVYIDQIVPGSSAAIAGAIAMYDEILEISGEEVNSLWRDEPTSEKLMSRLQERLNASPDHVTIRVQKQDGSSSIYRILRAPIIIPGVQHRQDGEIGIELAASGRHVVISRIRDGTPAFFSSVLSPGQRVISINLMTLQVEDLDAYRELDVGPVGHRVTYVIDSRIEYPDGDSIHQNDAEMEAERNARSERTREEMMETSNLVTLPLVRQIAITNPQAKLVKAFCEKHSSFFLSAKDGPDISTLKKPIVPTKPRRQPRRPSRPQTLPPPQPQPFLPPEAPPTKRLPFKKPTRAPPPKREYPPKKEPPPFPSKKIPPPAPTPKIAGIGMKISDSMIVTAFSKGGPAAECGKINMGDRLVEADGNDVRQHTTIDACSQFILGPVGSEISLKFSRAPAPRPAKPVKSSPSPNSMLGVGMKLEIKTKQHVHGKRVCAHFVDKLLPDGAAAECGLIQEEDQLVAIDGKDCLDLDGKQVAALIVGRAGTPVTMDFMRRAPGTPRAEPGTARSAGDFFQVVLTRGGEARRLGSDQLETEVEDPPDQELFDVLLIRGGIAEQQKFQAEVAAHEQLVERFNKENLLAEARYHQILKDDDDAYHKLCLEIDGENRRAEATYFESLENEDTEYQLLVKKVSEQNKKVMEAYQKRVEEQREEYNRKIREDEETYQNKIKDDEERYRLALEWWKFGGEIDPPTHGEADIEVLFAMDLQAMNFNVEHVRGGICVELAKVGMVLNENMILLDLHCVAHNGPIKARLRLREGTEGRRQHLTAPTLAVQLCKHTESLRSPLFQGTIGRHVMSMRVLPDGVLYKRPPGDIPENEMVGMIKDVMGSVQDVWGDSLLRTARLADGASKTGNVIKDVSITMGSPLKAFRADFPDNDWTGFLPNNDAFAANTVDTGKHWMESPSVITWMTYKQTASTLRNEICCERARQQAWAAKPSVITWNVNGASIGKSSIAINCQILHQCAEKRDSRKIASGMLGGFGWSEVFGIKDRTISKNQPLVSERTELAEEKKAKIDQFAADLTLQPASGRGDRSSLFEAMTGALGLTGARVGSMLRSHETSRAHSDLSAIAAWGALPSVVSWNIRGLSAKPSPSRCHVSLSASHAGPSEFEHQLAARGWMRSFSMLEPIGDDVSQHVQMPAIPLPGGVMRGMLESFALGKQTDGDPDVGQNSNFVLRAALPSVVSWNNSCMHPRYRTHSVDFESRKAGPTLGGFVGSLTMLWPGNGTEEERNRSYESKTGSSEMAKTCKVFQTQKQLYADEDLQEEENLSIAGFDITHFLKYPSGLPPSDRQYGLEQMDDLMRFMTAMVKREGSDNNANTDYVHTTCAKWPAGKHAIQVNRQEEARERAQSVIDDLKEKHGLETKLEFAGWSRDKIPDIEFRATTGAVFDPSGYSFVQRKDTPSRALGLVGMSVPIQFSHNEIRCPDLLDLNIADQATVADQYSGAMEEEHSPSSYLKTVGLKLVHREGIPQHPIDRKAFLEDLEEALLEANSNHHTTGADSTDGPSSSRSERTWKRPIMSQEIKDADARVGRR